MPSSLFIAGPKKAVYGIFCGVYSIDDFEFHLGVMQARSLILVSIESPHTTLYRLIIVTLGLSAAVSEILTVLYCRVLLFPYPTLVLAKIWDPSIWRRPMIFGMARATTLSYAAVKLFPKNSNLCDHKSQYQNVTDRRTDDLP